MAKRPQVEGSLAKKEKQVVVIEASHHAQPQKLRVAAYARVSSDSTDQLNSFLAQINHYSTYISSHEEWSFVDLYADEGISGTSAAKRPEFQRLVADCRRGLIDLVLCKSISRFARNSKDCLETLRELKNLGVGVYFEEQNQWRISDSGLCGSRTERKREHRTEYAMGISVPHECWGIYSIVCAIWI